MPGDFREDNLAEMRIGPCFVRMTGACIRCPTTYYDCSAEKLDEDKEPYATLSKIRSTPGYGTLFGTYYSCEILKTAT